MSRNQESHFDNVPTTEILRSKFNLEHNHKTTFNAARLTPFFVTEILPGDTFEINTSMVVRLQTPKFPTMDNLYLDYYYFFIPNRITWDHWKEFTGENTKGAWGIQTEYLVPQLTTPAGGMAYDSIAGYMGIPINIENIKFNALPIRAMTRIYNDWFRDQNLIAPDEVFTDDTNRTADNNISNLGGKCYKVAKFHDYFTSALPEPQKPYAGVATNTGVKLPIGGKAPIIWTGTWEEPKPYNPPATGINNPNVPTILDQDGKQVYSMSKADRGLNIVINKWNTPNAKNNLYVDLADATASTINALRLAFATQRILEKDARGGTRFKEIIQNHFMTTIPDERAQIPEYLGGKRIPINIEQIPQTSSTDTTSPQGNLAAYSQTNENAESFTKSFTEWGYIIGCLCVRHDNTYQQGLNRMWSRTKRLDFYWPTLANLGEQPIYNKEIFIQGNDKDNEVFGYQERWAEYRYIPNRISGEFLSTYATPLDMWHYGDHYQNMPMLNQQWIEATEEYIDRTISVTSKVAHQFFADIQIYGTMVRPMPIYSVPGLLDHF